ncbi:MAG: hypothetical protein AB1861_05545 [Cyanobacteriota bacterium]
MSKTKQRYKRFANPQVEPELTTGADLLARLRTESQARLYSMPKEGTKYERPRMQPHRITSFSDSISITKYRIISDTHKGSEEDSLLSYISAIKQLQGRRKKLKTGLVQKTAAASSTKCEDNFTSDNEELDITLARLQELLEEEDEDDYGVATPSAYAYGTALALVSEAARLIGDRFTRASASTDDRGGIRLTWTRPEAEVRLVCAHQSDKPTYLYHEAGNEYRVEHDVSASTLTHWLDWLNSV